jgi:hypothetical protein
MLGNLCDFVPAEFRSKPEAKEASRDTALFELGCYLYFRVALLHCNNGWERDLMFPLADRLLSAFEETCPLQQLKDAFNNRLNFYVKLAQEDRLKSVDLELRKLIWHSATDPSPTPCDLDKLPHVLVPLDSAAFFQILLNAFEKHLLASALAIFEAVYKATHEPR